MKQRHFCILRPVSAKHAAVMSRWERGERHRSRRYEASCMKVPRACCHMPASTLVWSFATSRRKEWTDRLSLGISTVILRDEGIWGSKAHDHHPKLPKIAAPSWAALEECSVDLIALKQKQSQQCIVFNFWKTSLTAKAAVVGCAGTRNS